MLSGNQPFLPTGVLSIHLAFLDWQYLGGKIAESSKQNLNLLHRHHLASSTRMSKMWAQADIVPYLPTALGPSPVSPVQPLQMTYLQRFVTSALNTSILSNVYMELVTWSTDDLRNMEECVQAYRHWGLSMCPFWCVHCTRTNPPDIKGWPYWCFLCLKDMSKCSHYPDTKYTDWLRGEVYRYYDVRVEVRGQLVKSHFSPLVMWDPGIRLQLLGFVYRKCLYTASHLTSPTQIFLRQGFSVWTRLSSTSRDRSGLVRWLSG